MDEDRIRLTWYSNTAPCCAAVRSSCCIAASVSLTSASWLVVSWLYTCCRFSVSTHSAATQVWFTTHGAAKNSPCRSDGCDDVHSGPPSSCDSVDCSSLRGSSSSRAPLASACEVT